MSLSPRELLENRRDDLNAQIAELQSRLDEVNFLLASIEPEPPVITRARNPRTIKREQSQ